ncbi:MAG: NYN domain-containing protein [Chloroflexi bacterium]|nr:NYN domain-containing protein [Chloroflexota bacterium]
MHTYVYIDGFNLYNGAVKRTPYKWLNLAEVCRLLFPGDQVAVIHYFTARVIGFDHDLQAPDRQEVYLNALRTLPNIRIHADGWFSSHPTLLPQYPLAYIPEDQKPPPRPPQLVQVVRQEEKRTDVDLATHLLMDCFNDLFEQAVVISNDGDLALPIRMVRDEFHKQITVVNPRHRGRVTRGLRHSANSYIHFINRTLLAQCQFPSELTDATGTISKPPRWSIPPHY